MADYKELIKRLRELAGEQMFDFERQPYLQAADAIEELLKAAKKMHLWIFLNTGDEQKAYDECGLTDEMNAALGYGGRLELRAEPSKGETE